MTGPADPGVYISPAQMYQEIRALHDALNRIDAKLDALTQRDQDTAEQLTDHETRLRSLERARWPLPSLAALVGLAALLLTVYEMTAR
ncbi:hypothetical protein ACGRHY_14415 [Streptomyces sp. HK10]|uniref:hypothetical protein n=1 Tax=Streptomyces sp. HK10 TaxID=3373255 RepID=UPI003748DF3D